MEEAFVFLTMFPPKTGFSFPGWTARKKMWKAYVKENTKAIYIETPTNPMMNVTDIAALAEIARRA